MVKRYGVPILRVYMVVLHVDKVFLWEGGGGGEGGGGWVSTKNY